MRASHVATAALCAAAAALCRAETVVCADGTTCAGAAVGRIFGDFHDVPYADPTPASAGGCCALCNTKRTCRAWTFIAAATPDCFLHDSAEPNVTSDARHTSGLRSGPIPPPSLHGWFGCLKDDANTTGFPFCDRTQTPDARADDLARRISIDEAGAQLTARQSPEVSRLGVPSYYWGTNAIHGIQNTYCLPDGQCPTSFPAPCGLAAAFNMSIVEGMGRVIGTELRAYYNEQAHNSLDTWSPTININRDPRWGRNVESPGEDPLVNGQFGSAYTRGLQEGDEWGPSGDGTPQAVVTLKHWFG